jgi:putative spermidine/putrescine transport system substrate-binding protein
VGTTWQYTANLLTSDKHPTPVATVLPKESSTAWSDTWMISSKAKHPNCMYRWMDHIISPKANAGVAQWFGEAPSNAKACQLTAKGFCAQFHANDESFFKRVSFWTTPTANCGDARGSVCKDYSQWVAAWTEVKG